MSRTMFYNFLDISTSNFWSMVILKLKKFQSKRNSFGFGSDAVSYTHLDVYKRQAFIELLIYHNVCLRINFKNK